MAGEISALLPETPTESELAGGEIHAYRIELGKDDFLEVVADQRGIDLELALLNAAGEPLLAIDAPGDAAGSERLPWRSSEAGSLLFLVCALGDAGERGSYRIGFEPPHPAEPADHKAVAAARAFAEAEELEDEQIRLGRYEEALEMWRELGDRTRQLDALSRLGRIRADRGEWRPALEHYLAAEPLFDAARGPRIEAAVRFGIGRCYFRLGEMEAAREAYRRADESWRRLDALHADRDRQRARSDPGPSGRDGRSPGVLRPGARRMAPARRPTPGGGDDAPQPRPLLPLPGRSPTSSQRPPPGPGVAARDRRSAGAGRYPDRPRPGGARNGGIRKRRSSTSGRRSLCGERSAIRVARRSPSAPWR